MVAIHDFYMSLDNFWPSNLILGHPKDGWTTHLAKPLIFVPQIKSKSNQIKCIVNPTTKLSSLQFNVIQISVYYLTV